MIADRTDLTLYIIFAFWWLGGGYLFLLTLSLVKDSLLVQIPMLFALWANMFLCIELVNFHPLVFLVSYSCILLSLIIYLSYLKFWKSEPSPIEHETSSLSSVK